MYLVAYYFHLDIRRVKNTTVDNCVHYEVRKDSKKIVIYMIEKKELPINVVIYLYL